MWQSQLIRNLRNCEVARGIQMKWICDSTAMITFVFPQFTSFHSVFHSYHGLMNSINWPAPSVWVFIAQLVDHCSANAEATGSNPVEAPNNVFSGYCSIAEIVIQLWWSHTQFICISAVHIILFSDNYTVGKQTPILLQCNLSSYNPIQCRRAINRISHSINTKNGLLMKLPSSSRSRSPLITVHNYDWKQNYRYTWSNRLWAWHCVAAMTYRKVAVTHGCVKSTPQSANITCCKLMFLVLPFCVCVYVTIVFGTTLPTCNLFLWSS